MSTASAPHACSVRPRVAVLYNNRIEDKVLPRARRAVEVLLHHGAAVVVDERLRVEHPDVCVAAAADIVGRADMAVVLGGDGTLIGAGRAAADANVPVLGLNLGTFGFLTEASADDMDAVLPKLVRGHYPVGLRLALRCRFSAANGDEVAITAINDVFVTNPVQGRILALELRVAEEPPLSFRADGLVVASPSGSTGHSLSAGGPIVFPTVDCLLLTPVCAHTLASRPIVIPSQCEARIQAQDRAAQLRVIIDGQLPFDVRAGSTLRVAKHPHGLRLFYNPAHSFSETLRSKFYLGQPHRAAL